ncbi:MAG: peptidyl-prolyl cis-trans isomerase [Candidatus Sumerlaeota bacterium]|nr:peptidyl-prolyl cis-trans isomerase [Candidatus Sumerlaeota bacterium]
MRAFHKCWLLLITIFVAGIDDVRSEVVARYDGGVVTAEEAVLYAPYTGVAFHDLLNALKSAADPNERSLISSDLNLVVEEIVWNRHMAAKARAEDIQLSAPLLSDVQSNIDSCVLAKWQKGVADTVTTLAGAELTAEFHKRREMFEHPEMRDVSCVFISTTATKTAREREAIKAQLEDAQAQIDAGKLTFADAARRYSEAPSAAGGGTIGTVSRGGQMNSQFVDLVFSLPVNTMSSVTLLRNGYYIIRVNSVVPEKIFTDEQASRSSEIVQTLLGIARKEAISSATKAAMSKHQDARNEKEAVILSLHDDNLTFPECEILGQLLKDRLLARQYFIAQHAREWEPSERELREYYEQNESQMLEDGQFRLTRFLIPVTGAADAVVRSRDGAEKIARRARAALEKGATTDALRADFAMEGLTIQPMREWVRGSNDARADQELLKMTPSGLTPVFIGADGAHFFRLDAKRKPARLPYEAKIAYITGNVRSLKTQKAYDEDRKQAANELKLTRLWDVSSTGKSR